MGWSDHDGAKSQEVEASRRGHVILVMPRIRPNAEHRSAGHPLRKSRYRQRKLERRRYQVIWRCRSRGRSAHCLDVDLLRSFGQCPRNERAGPCLNAAFAVNRTLSLNTPPMPSTAHHAAIRIATRRHWKPRASVSTTLSWSRCADPLPSLLLVLGGSLDPLAQSSQLRPRRSLLMGGKAWDRTIPMARVS